MKEGVHSHPAKPTSDLQDSETDMDEPSEPSQSSLASEHSDDSRDDEDSEDEHSEESSFEESEEEGKVWESWDEETDEELMDGEDESDVDMEDDEGSDDEDETDEASETDNVTLLMTKLKLHKKAMSNLSTESGPVRAAILQEASKDLICFICELCWNLLNGYFDLKRHEKNILRLYKEDIHAMIDENKSWLHKKEALIEQALDPFIPILFNVLLPHLT
ncbi:ribosomal biogenesis protein LAS1L-like [Thrips palmi]|uniref:Ribosomal biogenesis protein LAS1L-like n=1 Tax=Thrips palmi TaxID=161013 RepID=A0A6P8ZQB1_THRPL|nr:ribosomal biogenesis protein LAS1L-like [Thrips palmi]